MSAVGAAVSSRIAHLGSGWPAATWLSFLGEGRADDSEIIQLGTSYTRKHP